MGRITIKDIARLLAVNPSTVSRALKGHPDISEEMKIRVKQVAEELGYTPNFQAISFRKRKSRLIGLVIPDMNMFFFPAVIQSVEERVRREGYNLIVLHSNDQLAGEKNNVRIAQHLGMEGLLVSLSSESGSLDHFTEISEQGTPVVFFDRIIETEDFPTISIHDEAVARQAVGHLLEKGRRRICGVFGDPQLSISRLRLRGYQHTLQEAGLPISNHFILHAYNIDEARVMVESMLKSQNPPDAFFVMSDELLVGTMQALQATNISLPADISLISISDGTIPTFWTPNITYVKHSGYEVGALSANLLFNLINKHPVERETWVSTQLIINGTT